MDEFMDIRYTTNPYIDMDDLAKPWKINRKLSTEEIEREYIKKGILKEIASIYYPQKDEEIKEETSKTTSQVKLSLKLK